MKYALTIVTITKQDPLGLKRTIDSMQALISSTVPWQHVIVDASLKENQEIIASLPKEWPLEHIPNIPKGIYAAINQGIEYAQGEYLLLLHGGDKIHSVEALIENIEFLQNHPTVDLYLSGASLYRNNNFLYNYYPPRTLLRGILGSNRICHQAMIYKRRFFYQVGSFSLDYSIGGDYEHHFRAYLKNANYAAAKKVLVEYDMGGSSSNYKQAFLDFKKIHSDLESLLPFLINMANKVIWWVEYKKIILIKLISSSFIGNKILPIWLWWKNNS